MKRTSTLLIGALAAASLLGACGDDSGSKAVSEKEFCGMIQAYKDQGDSFDSALSSTDPADVEKAFTTMQGSLHDLASAAPSKVKADLDSMIKVVDRMIEIFDKYDWDFTKLQSAPEYTELTAAFENDDMSAANDRLDAYSQDVCGIATSS